MRFALMVTGPAYGTQQASSAYQFTQALFNNTEHELISIFFYMDGIYNANSLTSPASDEINLVHAWQNIYEKYGTPLYVCIAAALRRGVIDTTEAKRIGFPIANLQKGFLFSGLGELAKTALTCDRMVQF